MKFTAYSMLIELRGFVKHLYKPKGSKDIVEPIKSGHKPITDIWGVED